MSQSEEFDPVKFREEVKLELKTADRFRQYFSQFNQSSVDSFIEFYAGDKGLWHQFGEFYLQQNEEEQTRWIDEAHVHLGYILQKKLFDAQCLWRAQKVKFDGVLHTYDFHLWENNIFNCSFLEPITEADLDLYQQFLSQPAKDFAINISWYFEWQNYHAIKSIYNDADADEVDGEMPEWYEFHMNRTGNSSLLLLPDIIGEKERFYLKLVQDSQKEELEKAIREAEKKMDKRPSLVYHSKNNLEFFISTFEPKLTLTYYRAYNHYNRNRYEGETMERIIDVFLKEKEFIAIEAHHDWRTALQKAYSVYQRKKITEFLPMAYEQYLINISMNISFPTEEPRHENEEIRQHYINRIIKGRILNGEPPDLNY
jgi:hypothetical protein